MKRVLLILSFIALLSTSVIALSPTLEQECCFYLGHEEEKFGGYLVEACPELRLTEKKCEPILRGWESAQDDFARSTRPEYACCTYLGRDEEALEIFDADFVLKTCPEFNLNQEKCTAILYGFDYPEEEFNISTGTDEDKREEMPGLIILVLLAFASWLMRSGFRKFKKRK